MSRRVPTFTQKMGFPTLTSELLYLQLWWKLTCPRRRMESHGPLHSPPIHRAPFWTRKGKKGIWLVVYIPPLCITFYKTLNIKHVWSSWSTTLETIHLRRLWFFQLSQPTSSAYSFQIYPRGVDLPLKRVKRSWPPYCTLCSDRLQSTSMHMYQECNDVRPLRRTDLAEPRFPTVGNCVTH